VVATFLPTSIQFVICDMAIPKIGAIHLPGTMLDSADAIVDKLERSNCKRVISVHTNVKDRDIIDMIKDVAKVEEKQHPRSFIF